MAYALNGWQFKIGFQQVEQWAWSDWKSDDKMEFRLKDNLD